MTNDEKFNLLINGCKNKEQVFGVLSLFAMPGNKRSNDVNREENKMTDMQKIAVVISLVAVIVSTINMIIVLKHGKK